MTSKLQVFDWGYWATVGEFELKAQAVDYAQDRFPDYGWKILDTESNEVVAERISMIHSPDRFSDLARMNRGASRRVRLGEIARGHREASLESRSIRRYDSFDGNWGINPNLEVPKVNWKEEGF